MELISVRGSKKRGVSKFSESIKVIEQPPPVQTVTKRSKSFMDDDAGNAFEPSPEHPRQSNAKKLLNMYAGVQKNVIILHKAAVKKADAQKTVPASPSKIVAPASANVVLASPSKTVVPNIGTVSVMNADDLLLHKAAVKKAHARKTVPLSPSKIVAPDFANVVLASPSKTVVPITAHLETPKLNWKDFPVGQDKSPDTLARELELGDGHQIDTTEELEAGEGHAYDSSEGDATRYDVHNVSARDAANQNPTSDADVYIDLGNADGSTMTSWWETFMMGSCGGGFLARSLFSAAAQDPVLGSNRWMGPTSVTQKKQALMEMRIKFLEWTEVPATNEWVRSKLFNIIITNPKTYAMLKVTRLFFRNSSFLK
jgi:hypothetical protein